MRPSVYFYLTFGLGLCLSLLCVLFVSCWNTKWRGGFSWNGSALESNWHAVLMVCGLAVMYGNAAIVFRIPFTWKQNKYTLKLVHAGLMLSALFLSVLGMCAIFDYHKGLQIPHMYSLHSWVGICAIVLFAFQWVLGLIGFILPCSPRWFRSYLKPVHIWLGKVILMLSLASCISGINEKLHEGPDGAYTLLPMEAVFANVLGILIMIFMMVVYGILSKKQWMRPEMDDANIPLLSESRT
ncbi:lysosomal membrane ascorbate-dependent ferrireductase CYB561A3-like [Embiotoca jacksoni]|uniref:lysosomal membrane ascorbate-dependent ferrireductase CYB561A3-like n=1 Tax=Embiotoca jacksoni TaxID=100190 RepID=UPI0037044633